MDKEEVMQELVELVQSWNYNIVQQMNGGEETEYEGCEHSLMMWLNSGEATVTRIEATEPGASDGKTTYTVAFHNFMGDFVLTIWEGDE